MKQPMINDQPKIEDTRRELLNFLARQNVREERVATNAELNNSSRRKEPHPGNDGFSWSSLAEAALASWWRDHPARAGAMLVKSATEDFTRQKPLQVVTVAAIAGAAFVLFKPWRWVSTSALALTLFRSSNFTGIATSVLDSAAKSMQPVQKGK
ncbi:MAG: hypothetical protein H7203_00275 [Rhizobacter sp.]|nr:hypothetical protein [Burkholderiales bacterium]